MRLKYDYRREWLRFTQTLSQDDQKSPIEMRILKSIADILDSPAGALWLRQDHRLILAASWNLATTSVAAKDSETLFRCFETSPAPIDVSSIAKGTPTPLDLTLPNHLLGIENVWVIAPLVHRDNLLGVFVLTKPRADRDLDWEDAELLKTLGYHAASYIAEKVSSQELAEAKEFEKLNRRFAFALHDIKNLISRLSLLSTNFLKHGENKEFRKEMGEALESVTSQMTRLMESLQTGHTAKSNTTSVRPRPILEKLVAMQKNIARLICEDKESQASVIADPDRLTAVFAHLFENATQSAEDDGWVHIHLYQRDRSVIVEFSDNGCGMDAAFIEQELFRPFRSTKEEGFGLGAYQCREYVRELGGDIEVISSLGSGTNVRVILPTAGLLSEKKSPQASSEAI